jgi:hypothetical protein
MQKHIIIEMMCRNPFMKTKPKFIISGHCAMMLTINNWNDSLTFILHILRKLIKVDLIIWIYNGDIKGEFL